MAGEIQLNSTTFATESAGTITVANVDSATNRQNLGLEIGVDVQAFDTDTTKNDVANTFTANQIISVTDNTNAALRVTQLGTGNALVVEDETNPDSTPFVVDASGNVGIGMTPSQLLDLSATSGLAIRFYNSGTFKGGMQFVDSAGQMIGSSVADDLAIRSQSDMLFSAGGNTEAMRIDSSGNVLVGKTAVSLGTAGHEIKPGSEIRITRDGGIGLQLNRLTSDGEIINIRKDSTTVGSIGTRISTECYISLGSSGLTSSSSGGGALLPTTGGSTYADDVVDLGFSSGRFDDIYATNATIQTSDANEKEDIVTSDLSLDFIKQLNPVSYRFIGKTRTHYGLIAQEIETLLSTIGKETTDFAGFIKSPVIDDDGNETGEYKYGLRYSEFISPMIKAIQEQQSQIDALTARIEALETA